MRLIANQRELQVLGVVTTLLLLVSPAARGTTVVVARSANEIVIGADSKVTDTYGKELSGQVCKIQQERRTSVRT